MRTDIVTSSHATSRQDGWAHRLVAVTLGIVLVASGCTVATTGAAQDTQDPRLQAALANDDGALALAGIAPRAAEMAAAAAVSAARAAATDRAAGAVAEPPVTAGAVPPSEGEATDPVTADARRSDEPKADKPRVRTIRLKPRPRPGPFSMNVYRPGAFVHQQTKDWCVAGSTQTMMNMMDDGRPNRSRAFQERLYLQGRRLSPNKAKLGSIGVDLTGWAELLNTHGYGPYVVDGAATRRGAIKRAAKALRMTGKPVGLVTWRGAHSWVMSGFTATADPAHTNDFQVKKVNIQDVWYPYVSTIWGASRPPDSLVPVAALAEDFLPYRRPQGRYPKRDGKYMLILPRLPRNTVAR